MSGEKDRAKLLARGAVAWLDERKIPPTPNNFELAYAYVEGENVELRRGFDALIAVGSSFDPETMNAQHERYFGSGSNDEKMAEFSGKLSTEVTSVLQLIEKASQDHSAYKQTLSSASGE